MSGCEIMTKKPVSTVVIYYIRLYTVPYLLFMYRVCSVCIHCGICYTIVFFTHDILLCILYYHTIMYTLTYTLTYTLLFLVRFLISARFFKNP